jgi:hypothetical protein
MTWVKVKFLISVSFFFQIVANTGHGCDSDKENNKTLAKEAIPLPVHNTPP